MSGVPMPPSAAPHTAPVVPSRYAYTRYQCRCQECREANREYQQVKNAERARRLAAEFDRLPHGSASTYGNWGCRCVPCAEAMSRKNDRASAVRKAAAMT